MYAIFIALCLREEIGEDIQDMIDTGIVRESDSPYGSSMVVVKKDGSNRICVDDSKLIQNIIMLTRRKQITGGCVIG